MYVSEAWDFEIERRLESYARARLSADPQVVARIRARVMREARIQAGLPRIAVLAAPTVGRARLAGRRISIGFLAAAVWLGVAAGSIFAAQAGGPLYPARVWIEQATLPSDAGARTTAEFARLDARLADALAAAARGDSGAVQAALDSYRQIADDTIAGATGNADLEALVLAALQQHVLVLSDVAAKLADKGDTTAAAAVEASIARAIDHTQAALVRLGSGLAGPGGAGGTGATGGSGSGSGSGGSVSGAGGDAQPSPAIGDPRPTKPPKPTPEATPTPTPTPAATAKPTPDTTPNKPSASPTARPTPKAAPRDNGANN